MLIMISAPSHQLPLLLLAVPIHQGCHQLHPSLSELKADRRNLLLPVRHKLCILYIAMIVESRVVVKVMDINMSIEHSNNVSY